MRLAPTRKRAALCQDMHKHNMMCFYRLTLEYLNRSRSSTAMRGLLITDRRPLNPNVIVQKPGGGIQPRTRNQDGQVRDKRSDAGNLAKTDASKASRQLFHHQGTRPVLMDVSSYATGARA